ncbi:MAG: DNA adenine methylase [Caldilineaceae bacterium]
MKKLPQPIPYQGSKRNIADLILDYFPQGVARMVELFAGSAALSIAVSYRGLAQKFWLNDLNQPLAELIRYIIENPLEIADKYQTLWEAQLGQERQFYDDVRDEFNRTHCPEQFLYLLARCVKASVRYNSNGEFNQSPDNRRKGRHPTGMRREIQAFSALLKGRTKVTSLDFRDTIALIEPTEDFVYLDPPYQGTSGTRDARYCSGVDLSELVAFLDKLNQRNIMFALSYDGVKGDKSYGAELPNALGLYKILLDAGRSTQSTLLGQDHITYESLYLSPALVSNLDLKRQPNIRNSIQDVQTIRRVKPVDLQLTMDFSSSFAPSYFSTDHILAFTTTYLR